MPGQTPANPDNIDIGALFSSLGRSWKKLLVLTLGSGAVAFAAMAMIKPTFTSEAQIAIVPRGEANPFVDPKAGASGEAMAVRVDREAINTHARALLATELAQRVSREMKLAEKPEFNAAAGPNGLLDGLIRVVGIGQPRASESDEDRVLTQFGKRLAVNPTRDSRAIAIRFASQDRELAAEIANRLGEVYREQLAARSIRESNDVQSGLSPRIERLKQEVAEAEGEVERFRGTANIFKAGPQSSLNDQQLGELTAAESKAKTELGEAEARVRAARELMVRGSAEVHPDVMKSVVVQKLVQDRARLEADIAKASATMKDGHPALKQLRSEMTATERQIVLEVKRVIDGLDKEASVSRDRLASVQRSIADVKSRVVSTGGDQARLSQLEANAKAKRGELDRLQAQFEANRARSDTRIVPIEVQFISQARPAGEPTFPKPLPYSALVMMATMLLSSAFVIARELVVGARTPKAPKRMAMPTLDGAADHSAVSELGLSPVAEQPLGDDEGRVETIIELCQRLESRRSGDRALRTLMAGAGASIDPSAEAVEAVRVIARNGTNVLLVDWSLDGAGVARLLGVPTGPGLAELIDNKCGFTGTITRVPGSSAHLLPCGEGLVSASGRGDVDRLNLLLDTLDEIYDQIIVAARFNAARDLFETIEGRFDVGVLIGEPPRRPKTLLDQPVRTFLGFEVEELEIVRLARNAAGGRRRERSRAAA